MHTTAKNDHRPISIQLSQQSVWIMQTWSCWTLRLACQHVLTWTACIHFAICIEGMRLPPLWDVWNGSFFSFAEYLWRFALRHWSLGLMVHICIDTERLWSLNPSGDFRFMSMINSVERNSTSVLCSVAVPASGDMRGHTETTSRVTVVNISR